MSCDLGLNLTQVPHKLLKLKLSLGPVWWPRFKCHVIRTKIYILTNFFFNYLMCHMVAFKLTMCINFKPSKVDVGYSNFNFFEIPKLCHVVKCNLNNVITNFHN
jgi:hypothetical protein